MVIAASSAAAARRCLRTYGIEPAMLVTKVDIRQSWRTVRRLVRSRGIKTAIVHSNDWSRQVMPQLFEAFLFTLPASRRLIVDGRTGTIRPVAHTTPLRWPFDGAKAAAEVSGATRSFRAFARGSSSKVRRRVRREGSPTVLLVWPGSPDTDVGGAVTHASGIAAGFSMTGARVALVTTSEPPKQLAEFAHDVMVLSPLSAGKRLMSDVARLAVNRSLLNECSTFAKHVGADVLYQRNAGFLFAGAEVARRLEIPLVLEWNGSEAWARAEWESPPRLSRTLDGLHGRIERSVVRASSLVAAVSEPAAHMALKAGASPATVRVIPNGVDVGGVQRITAGVAARGGTPFLVGWVGTFGPWHGARVLVEALRHIADVELLLIGEGVERVHCQNLSKEWNVNHRIEWAGALPRSETLQRLASCDVLASPHVPLTDQRFFGSPTKLFEYMALKRPIVASRLEQLAEVLEDGRTAVLVAPGDPAALAEGIRRIMALPDRGHSLGHAAAEQAAAKHDWTHRAQVILDVLSRPDERGLCAA